MDPVISHSQQEKIESISERIKAFTPDKNAWRSHLDPDIHSENLQFNLSLIIAHIISNLELPDQSMETLLKSIEDFNKKYDNNLTITDFTDTSWIRIIGDKVILPGTVNSDISAAQQDGHLNDFPSRKRAMFNCLRSYSEIYLLSTYPKISFDSLNKILTKSSSPEISAGFFVSKGLLEVIKGENAYQWVGGDYLRFLNTEISATLWILSGGESATASDLKKYLWLVCYADLFSDNLQFLLNKESVKNLLALACEFLINESDLKNSKRENDKKWYDASFDSGIHLDMPSPYSVLEFANSVELIQEFTGNFSFNQENFAYQPSRYLYKMAVWIVLMNEPPRYNSFEYIKKLLNQHESPYLVWLTYAEVLSHRPEIIPYLLYKNNLAPLSFLLLDDLKFEELLFGSRSDLGMTTREACKEKNVLWLEMFDLLVEQFEYSYLNKDDQGHILASIILDISKKVYHNPFSTLVNDIKHDAYLLLFKSIMLRLGSRRLKSTILHPSVAIYPRQIFLLLPNLAKFLETEKENIKALLHHIFFIDLPRLNIYVELLRQGNARRFENEITLHDEQALNKALKTLVTLSEKIILEFYTTLKITVKSRNFPGYEEKAPSRADNTFGFELIDWGYLFLHFQNLNLLLSLHSSFLTHLKFDSKENKFADQNREQAIKLKLYLQSLLLGFISISQNSDNYEAADLPVRSTLKFLENKIKELSKTFSINNLPTNRIDIFDEDYGKYSNNRYYQNPQNSLFKAINLFHNEDILFIRAFFEDSVDIGRMLKAINLLESQEIVKTISEQIKEIDIEKFINSKNSTLDLQFALIEAVNTKKHWPLAKPLLDKITSHIDKQQFKDLNSLNTLFEINLLIALKEKNLSQIESLPIPKSPNHSEKNPWGEAKKEFFRAIFALDENKNYDAAIQILEPLLSRDNKNVTYAFYLYRAKTLKSHVDDEKNQIFTAAKEWEDFTGTINDAENKKELSQLTDAIANTSLFLYAYSKNSKRFDLTISGLPNDYLFEEDLIPLIYNYYIERKETEIAYDYITMAAEYLTLQEIAPAPEIQYLIDNSESGIDFRKFKSNLGAIGRLSPKNIPRIVPEVLNGFVKIDFFILNELVQGLKVILEKRQTLSQVTHENRFNDYLQAVLRLRFALWGWSLQDQPRVGVSPVGLDAGSADIVIQSGGAENIALIEAFILGDAAYTKLHISKCPKYLSSIDNYYTIVFYFGVESKFTKSWEKYKVDVPSTPLENSFEFDKTKGFEDLTDRFENVNGLKISRTYHGIKAQMFHVMVNLGERDRKIKKK